MQPFVLATKGYVRVLRASASSASHSCLNAGEFTISSVVAILTSLAG